MMMMIFFLCIPHCQGPHSGKVSILRDGTVFGSAPGVFMRIPHPKPHISSEAPRHFLCFVFGFFFA